MFGFNFNIHKPKIVNKLWGKEIWIHNSDLYCGKLLVFDDIGSSFSMHYHMEKNESWFVQGGNFHFEWIDTENGKRKWRNLRPGDVVDVPVGLPHKLTALSPDCVIFEVSEEHYDNDSYRIYREGPDDLK